MQRVSSEMRSRVFSFLSSQNALCRCRPTLTLAASQNVAHVGQHRPISRFHQSLVATHQPQASWSRQQIMRVQRGLATNSTAYNVKAWLDPSRSLASRVKALMDTPNIHPTEITLPNSNLAALLTECCKMKNLEGMQLAQEIMDRILVEKGRYRDEEVDVLVPARMWQIVLYGWVQLAATNAVALGRMRDLMDTIIQEAKADVGHLKKLKLFNEDEIGPSQPTVDTFNTFLEGLAQAAITSRGAAMIAEQTIFDMKNYNTRFGWHTKPNTRSYTYAIKAHANSHHPKSGEKAIAILRHVQADHKAEAAAFREKRGVEYSQENLSTTAPKIVTADAAMYSITMKAVLTSKSSFNLLAQLLDEASQDGVADRIHYNMAMNGLAQKIENTQSPSRRLVLAERTEKLLEQSLKCAENPSASEISSVNACLNVWSRAFISEMGPRVEDLLKDMLARGAVPNCATFHFLIRAWSKSFKFHGEKALQRVEAALKFQRELAYESKNGEIPYPDYQAYALAILAFNGRGKDSVVRAANLLEDMLVARRDRTLTTELGNPCAPFSSLLSVTAGSPKVKKEDSTLWSDEELDPYEVASRIYEHVTQNVPEVDGLVADHHFYGAFFRTLLAHGYPKSVDFKTTALRAWEHACEAGQVSRLVLPHAMKIPVVKETIPDYESVKKCVNLPRFWWRNIEPQWR